MIARNIFITCMMLSSLLSVYAEAAAQQAAQHGFEPIYRVLTHPRCLNCHPNGDTPKQGLDAHFHEPRVKRGPNDRGVAGLQCMSCHQAKNYAASGVPGALNWHLAPLSMAWENLSPGELCRALLDTRKNGNKDLKAIVEHLTRDELVAWGWKPGVDANGKARAPVPIPKAEFNRIVLTWAKRGAQCPQ